MGNLADDLCAEVRHQVEQAEHFKGLWLRANNELEQLHAELAAKTAERDKLLAERKEQDERISRMQESYDALFQDRERLLKERNEMEAQEPVGEVDGFGSVWWKDRPPQGAKLYTHPIPAVPEGYKLLKNTTHEERSYPEDASHENGNYFNVCHECLREFTGHKRRGICRACAAPKGPI